MSVVKVFIGRFQPFHSEHKAVVDMSIASADKVIVIIGSAFQPRNIENPFTFAERMNMIKANYPNCSKLIVEPIRNTIYNDQKWASRIQDIVIRNTKQDDQIQIVGHEKDDSSFYLRMFPQWYRIDTGVRENISATEVRKIYFEGGSEKFYEGALPIFTRSFLNLFRNSEDYAKLVREYEFIKKYKEEWKKAPYAPTFVTTDAVVVQSGHVLMVKRRAAPGEGLWALPGGFLNQDERIVDGIIRELREETQLKVPGPVLKGSIKDIKVFDHPKRSLRGRTITHAALIQLPDGELPHVKGTDDAEKAIWVPIAGLNTSLIYEDHYDIIVHLLGSV